MEIRRTLELGPKYSHKKIYFGVAKTPEELNDVFSLRFSVYSEKNYIDPKRYPDGLEKDSYDQAGKCVYFIAKFDDRTIGCIRIIFDQVLPTEKAFVFSEPQQVKEISRSRRCELGRFIIIPPDKKAGIYLPRGLVMLLLLDVLSSYGIENGYDGGYSFIKTSLMKKMERLKLPFGRIQSYKQVYPNDGVLYGYFNQSDDPVIPIYFLTEEFKNYCAEQIHRSGIFNRLSETDLQLRHNLYVSFLQMLKII